MVGNQRQEVMGEAIERLPCKRTVAYFPSGGAQLSDWANRRIKQVVRLLGDYPSARVQITASTDCLGPYRWNERLAEHRAAAVSKALLVSGIAPEKQSVELVIYDTIDFSKLKKRRLQLDRRVELTVFA